MNFSALGGLRIRIFSLLWMAYASYYLCRMNFAVAQPQILREFPAWTAAQVGLIPSVYAALYAIGQFVNGQLAERFGARAMVTVALLLIAVLNLLFATTSSYGLMLFFWGCNGYAQSTGWSLLVKTISNWTALQRRGMVIGLLSTCYQVGNAASWLLAGSLVETLGWRAAFWVPALGLFPMAALFLWGVRNDPSDMGLPPVRDDLGAAPPSGERSKGLEAFRATLANGTLWVLGLGYFCMNSVRYAFMNWSVQYLADFHGCSIKGSAFMAVALPMIGAAGAVFAGWASDALFGKRRAPVCALMLFLMAAVCVAFIYIPKGQWLVATGMLGLAGFLIFGPDVLIAGVAVVDAHPRFAAAATGLTMSLGAVGAIFSGVGVGWLKDRMQGEWSLVFWVLAGLALLSAFLMVSIWQVKPRRAEGNA